MTLDAAYWYSCHFGKPEVADHGWAVYPLSIALAGTVESVCEEDKVVDVGAEASAGTAVGVLEEVAVSVNEKGHRPFLRGCVWVMTLPTGWNHPQMCLLAWVGQHQRMASTGERLCPCHAHLCSKEENSNKYPIHNAQPIALVVLDCKDNLPAEKPTGLWSSPIPSPPLVKAT
jgi:hypothetical protein